MGEATALVFAQNGAKVADGDLNEDKAAETVRKISDAGGTAQAIAGDSRR